MTARSPEFIPTYKAKAASVPGRLWRFIREHGWKDADLKQEVIVTPEGIITPQRQKLLTRIGQEDEKQQRRDVRGSGILMLYGPPGTGKTTIVKEYARTTEKTRGKSVV